MRASVHRFAMRDPSDVSALAEAIDAGRIHPAHIVAFIGKTEGNGLVNDFTRGYLVQSLCLLLADRLIDAAEFLRAPRKSARGRRQGSLPRRSPVPCATHTFSIRLTFTSFRSRAGA